jgi:hypothetical protein
VGFEPTGQKNAPVDSKAFAPLTTAKARFARLLRRALLVEISGLLLSYPTLIVFPPSSGAPNRLDEALAAIGVHVVSGWVTQ